MNSTVVAVCLVVLSAVAMTAANVLGCGKFGSYNQEKKLCTCDNGWTGVHCDQLDCMHGHRSLETCVCESLWTGAVCDVPVCTGNRTLNANSTGCVCMANYQPPDCQRCAAAYFGHFCQHRIQPSTPSVNAESAHTPRPRSRSHLPPMPHWAKVTLLVLTALALVLLLLLTCAWIVRLCSRPHYSKIERLTAQE